MKDFSFMTIVLVALNFFDIVSSFYAINILTFTELNPLAEGFPIWILVLKFAICFIPIFCAYTLDKFGVEKYMLLPFTFLAILVGFYAFVVGLNFFSILGL